jgi:ribosomal protein S18 acetylase RimI-like enzyme
VRAGSQKLLDRSARWVYRPRRMLLIRAATEADVPNVLTLWQHATTEPSATDSAAGITTLLRHDEDALLLAIDDDQLVGTVIATWDGWRGSMYRLAVVASHRRRGIGRALVAEGERRLQEQGARRLHLIVAGDQNPARAFWDATGYRRTGQLRFVKDLDSPDHAPAIGTLGHSGCRAAGI